VSTPASPPTDLRPLALGEIVDRTATFWRTHLGALFRLFLGYQLCVYALSKSFVLLASRYFPLFGRGGVQLASNLDAAALLKQYLSACAAAMLLAVAVLWMSWQIGVAGTRYAVTRLTGAPAPLEDCLRRMWQKFGATTGAFLLSLLWALGISLLCMLPGTVMAVLGALFAFGTTLGLVAVIGGIILTVLGGVVGLLWYALRFMLVSQVLAMEDVGALGAYRRCGALVRGKLGAGPMGRVALRATLLYTSVLLLVFSVSIVSSMPSFIIQVVFGHIFDPSRTNPDAVPQLLLVPAELFQVGIQALFAPLVMLCAAFFYVDMRVRREGLDLELKLGATQPPEAQG